MWSDLFSSPIIPYFVFFFGLCIGSFISLLQYRLPRKLPWVAARSKCTLCDHVLSPKELIPVVSFAIQRGKCACGKTKIAWRYPLLELACGFLFLGVYFLGKS